MLTEADRPRRCAVLGSPIRHSLSPVIHRAAYRYLRLDWQYTAHEVDEGGLAGFVAGLDTAWRGLSLTMPLKRVALDVAHEVSDLARTVAAANTLIRADDGHLFADNTDVLGVVAALKECGRPPPRTVCVWGGGATAASVLAAVSLFGARTSHVHARSAERARPALAVADVFGHRAEPVAWAVTPACARAGLTVNTAPAGALDDLAAQVGAHSGPDRTLFDVLYDPWPTPLAARWAEGGGTVISGLDLLVHQASGQIALMTERQVPVRVLREAAEQALAARPAP